MKIALVNIDLNIRGGTHRQMLLLGKYLKNMGHDVYICTCFYNPDECYSELLNDFNVKYLFRFSREEMYKFWDSKLKKIKLNIFLDIYKRIKLGKLISKLIDKDTDLVNLHDFPFASLYIQKRFLIEMNRKIPIVYTLNENPSLVFFLQRYEKTKGKYKLVKFFFKLIDLYHKKFIKECDVITVLDNFNLNLLKRYFNLDGIIVRSGVEIEKYRFNLREINLNNIKLLTINILAKHRRIEDILYALDILVNKYKLNVFLTIVGRTTEDLEYFNFLKEIIKKKNLKERVVFTGQIEENELIGIFKSHDIFIFPNHNQTWGLSVLEAMASGLPVIVSKTSGVSEVLRNGYNALLISPKSPDEIAESILRLIKDPSLFSSLSINGRKLVEEEFNFKNYALNMDRLFKSLVKYKHNDQYLTKS